MPERDVLELMQLSLSAVRRSRELLERTRLVQLHQNAQGAEDGAAMAAGMSKTLWSMEDLCEKIKPDKTQPV